MANEQDEQKQSKKPVRSIAQDSMTTADLKKELKEVPSSGSSPKTEKDKE